MNSDWLESFVFLLYKDSGSVNNVEIYRSIFLTNSIAKPFEKIILNRLNIIIKENYLINKPEFAFKEKASTNLNLLCT